MHMGNMATVGHHGPSNFKHIVVNNGAHDSVGGQPTDAVRSEDFRITQVALGLGYKQVLVCCTSFVIYPLTYVILRFCQLQRGGGGLFGPCPRNKFMVNRLI